MTLGELRRAPTGNWLSYKLLGGDEKREAYENDDGVLATQPVHVVVVGAEANLLDAQQRFEQSIHRVSVVDASRTFCLLRSVGLGCVRAALL